MAFEILKDIYWTGKIDWELRSFHGEELSTHKGSSYNSYLIRDEKNVLIDTVWSPYTEEFVSSLNKIIPLEEIDMIISTHAEPDHSGALPELIKLIPDVPVYCSGSGRKSLSGYYHRDWNFQPVKTGDKISTGKREITFIEAPMLHWPDTLMFHLSGDNILFSSDVFGQHYASEFMFNDKISSEELFYEAMKYFACIISPFSQKVSAKIKELQSLNFPIEMICPAHGVIWRKDHKQIIDKYSAWADNYTENQITIVYDTMYNSTRRIAEQIVEGIRAVNSDITIKLFNSSKTDISDIITEIFRSKIIGIGSPTVNNGTMSSIASLLEEIKHMNLKDRACFTFGSYGWSGISVDSISSAFEVMKLKKISDNLKINWSPGEADLQRTFEYGQEIGKLTLSHIHE